MKLTHTLKLTRAGALRQTYFLIWPYIYLIYLFVVTERVEASQRDMSEESVSVACRQKSVVAV